jgi:hypothetical protein
VSQERDLDAMLLAESVDAGCAAGFEVLHRYVEEELAGGDAAKAQPGLATHLESCPACRQDYLGLVEAVQTFGNVSPAGP